MCNVRLSDSMYEIEDWWQLGCDRGCGGRVQQKTYYDWAWWQSVVEGVVGKYDRGRGGSECVCVCVCYCGEWGGEEATPALAASLPASPALVWCRGEAPCGLA
ncbi:hypothetical protein Pcinc_007702 [Petrolisthes cinctipes]|uniref:Uncharacterized protein n=1 Tax=Petrolisthes cinctipes TaxID=88211 RepID=A0AAE1G7Y4_PETCI|nr:hypothetical protein Pcinc_007702 [Petrolisthes cinctipes]